eukprot:EG_transcript_53786
MQPSEEDDLWFEHDEAVLRRHLRQCLAQVQGGSAGAPVLLIRNLLKSRRRFQPAVRSLTELEDRRDFAPVSWDATEAEALAQPLALSAAAIDALLDAAAPASPAPP